MAKSKKHQIQLKSRQISLGALITLLVFNLVVGALSPASDGAQSTAFVSDLAIRLLALWGIITVVLWFFDRKNGLRRGLRLPKTLLYPDAQSDWGELKPYVAQTLKIYLSVALLLRFATELTTAIHSVFRGNGFVGAHLAMEWWVTYPLRIWSHGLAWHRAVPANSLATENLAILWWFLLLVAAMLVFQLARYAERYFPEAKTPSDQHFAESLTEIENLTPTKEELEESQDEMPSFPIPPMPLAVRATVVWFRRLQQRK